MSTVEIDNTGAEDTEAPAMGHPVTPPAEETDACLAVAEEPPATDNAPDGGEQTGEMGNKDGTAGGEPGMVASNVETGETEVRKTAAEPPPAPNKPDEDALKEPVERVKNESSLNDKTTEDDTTKDEKTGGGVWGEIWGDGLVAGDITAGNVYIGCAGSPETRGETLIDPTKPFNFTKDDARYTVEEGLLEASRKLREESLVIVACDDHSVAISGAFHLSRQCRGDQWGDLRRFSKIDATALGNAGGGAEVPADHCFSLSFLMRNLEKIPRNSTVIIDLTSEFSAEDAKYFLSPFLDPEAQAGFFPWLKRLFSENQVRIVCLAPQKIARADLLAARVHVWKLSPIKILMHHHFSDEAPRLYASIRKQIDEQKWGTPALDAVHASIGNGSLRSLIEHYDLDAQEEKREDEAEFAALLGDGDPHAPIHEAVLFTAVHFPKLSEYHFEHVLSVLLGDDPVPAAAEKSAAPSPGKIPKEASPPHASGKEDQTVSVTVDGHTVTISKPSPESAATQVTEDAPAQPDPVPETAGEKAGGARPPETLMQLWYNGARKKISKDCRINLNTGPSGRDYIWFSAPHLSALARKTLDQSDPFHFGKYFERILESGLIFHDSKEISDSTLELIRQRMLRAPDQYNGDWLIRWVGGALFVLQAAQEFRPEDDRGLVRQLQVLAQEPRLMSRWTQLLRMMLGDKKLAGVTNDFLMRLVDLGEHDRVLQFVHRLRDSPGFDVIHWLKRLIAEGDGMIRQRASRFLAVYVREHVTQRPELFSTFVKWSPAPDSEGKLAPLQEAALLLPLGLAILEIRELDTDSKALPGAIFPVVVKSEVLTTSEIFEDAMAILQHPRQGWRRGLTTELQKDVLRCLLGEIRISTVSEGGKRTRPLPPANYILGKGLHRQAGYDGVLALLLVAWAWRFTAPPRKTPDRETGERVLAHICQAVAGRASKEGLKRIRNFLSEIRNRARDTGVEVAPNRKRERKILSRFATVCRTVSNTLYQARKRKGASV